MDEAKVEAEITAKGLTAPRLTPESIDAVIVYDTYHLFPGTTVTVCLLKLRNGFNVVGQSACASPANFDEAIGQTLAYDDARSKVWQLEGYLLRQMLHVGTIGS